MAVVMQYDYNAALEVFKFYRQFFSECGTIGLMANEYAESGYRSNNAQNSYMKKMGMTDEEYVAKVDSGEYKNFVNDSVGFGLCQWTHWSRKQGLYDYIKSKGKSIADFEFQKEFSMIELRAKKSLYKHLQESIDERESAKRVMLEFERPGDQSVENQERRADYATELYKVFIGEKEEVKEEMERKYSVCIDPGHGGKENRSPGVPEYYESEMVLKLSLRQKYYLEQLGVEVILTRSTANTNPALQARGKASAGCDLFISNHSNAVGNGMNENIDHVALYHLTDDSTTEADEISKELAQRLAPAIAQIMGVEDGYKVLQRKAQSDRNKDGMFNDNYYGVLHGARLVNTPGIILEHGFHTHTATVKWLLDDKNLDMLARMEAQIIYEFLVELGTRIKVAQPILRQGNSGYQVGLLQENLNHVLGDDLKEKLKIDRDFGPATAAAMELFQEKYGLEQDKIYGPKSYIKMKEILEAMAKEEVVLETPKADTPEIEVPKVEEKVENTYCVHVGALTKLDAESLRDVLKADGYSAVVVG